MGTKINLGGRQRVIDERIAWDCYKAGKTDAEIAQACGVHKNTVANWRRRNTLHANTPQKKQKEEQAARKKKERVLSPLEQDAKAAREAGLTYGQYKAQQYIDALREKERMQKRYRIAKGEKVNERDHVAR